MILVTTGTNGAPFDRLLLGLDGIAHGEPLVVQHGPSRVRPAGAHCVEYLEFDDLVDHVRRARVVVSHCGTGSIVVALMNGRRPVVVPRLAAFGEAIDDHQLALGRKLADAGLVELVADAARLADVLAAEPDEADAWDSAASAPLTRELAAYLRAVVGG